MSKIKPSQHDLQQELRSFYNRNAAYFAETREANRELTPERAALFGWIAKGDRVLDVGCGTCENSLHMDASTAYFGCDVSLIALQMAAEAAPGCARGLAQGESQCLPFSDGVFDAVLSTYALEHFVFPRESLDEMWRVCRPEGNILLVSPSYDDPLALPPSTSHWNSLRRAALIAAQFWRQCVRHIMPGHFFFTRIEQPRVLKDDYKSDYDAIHLVSAREVASFFRRKGAEVLFERKRCKRAVSLETAGLLRWTRDLARNVALHFHMGEYAGLNLQLVARKPLASKQVESR